MMSALSTGDVLTTIFGIIATVLTIVTIAMMVVVRSPPDETEDPEQAQGPSDVNHLRLFQIIMKLIETVRHPETYQTIRRHLSAVNAVRATFKSSITKIETIFQTGMRILRPVFHRHHRHASDISNLDPSPNAPTGAQHELQIIPTA